MAGKKLQLKEDLINNFKICKICNKTKKLDDFYFHTRANLYNNICKECQKKKYPRKIIGKFTRLSENEKTLIIKLYDIEKNITKIANKIRRSQYTISLFLNKIGKHKTVKRIKCKDKNCNIKDNLRKNPEMSSWKKSVYRRDNFICQKCHKSSGELNAHHLNGYHWDEEDRLNIENGVTLCKKCHMEFHVEYGHSHNTIIQYNIWNENKQINNTNLVKIAILYNILIKKELSPD